MSQTTYSTSIVAFICLILIKSDPTSTTLRVSINIYFLDRTFMQLARNRSNMTYKESFRVTRLNFRLPVSFINECWILEDLRDHVLLLVIHCQRIAHAIDVMLPIFVRIPRLVVSLQIVAWFLKL